MRRISSTSPSKTSSGGGSSISGSSTASLSVVAAVRFLGITCISVMVLAVVVDATLQTVERAAELVLALAILGSLLQTTNKEQSSQHQ